MKKLKIRSYSMMSTYARGSAASWALTIHYLAKAFLKQGHDLYLNTTNDIRGVPKELLKYFRDCLNPDINFSYCTPNNYAHRFSNYTSNKINKMRLGVLNFESSQLPKEWIEHHQYVDYILPSSSYSADIFLKGGIPEEKVVVMPLGIDFDSLNMPIDKNFQLPTKKKFKLLNVSIAHLRKNIPLLIDAYFEEFSLDDDICLIIKTNLSTPKESFDIDVKKALAEVEQKHIGKKLPELILLEQRFDNMATLYKQCNALINVAASEGFGLPILEGAACGMIVAAPRYGGVLDFLEHNKNSLLIDTDEIKAPPGYEYWNNQNLGMIGWPAKESIMATMRKMYDDNDELHNKFDSNMKLTTEKYTWDNSVKVMMDLYEGNKPKKNYGELL